MTIEGRREVRRDLKMTREKAAFLKTQIASLSDGDLIIIYNRVSGYKQKYFRVGNHYFKGYMIQNLIEKRWGRQ